ncbi:UNVERIFIED_CONTAM: hypothetical protein RMT77_012887 [Armadillidium vulgare]
MAEEIEDETVVDSWEDFEENPDVLDQQLKKMSLKNEKSPEKDREPVIMVSEDNQRSGLFNPLEPKIMILRRPPKQEVEHPNGMVSLKQKHPVKSLQQRQAEYAEARLRILGNSGSSTTEESPQLKPLQSRTSDQIPTQEETFSTQNSPANTFNLTENSRSALSLSTSTSTKPIAFIKPSTTVTIARTPRGPTNSQIGFQISRSGFNHPS